jgi:hypothetical protein
MFNRSIKNFFTQFLDKRWVIVKDEKKESFEIIVDEFESSFLNKSS